MKRITVAFLMTAVLGLMGTTCGPYSAPYTASLTVPDDITLYPSPAFEDTDGSGILMFMESMVYDSSSGAPLNNIKIDVTSASTGIYIIPESAIMLADMPSVAEGVEDADDIAAICDQNEDGFIDDTAGEWCSWYWDTESGVFYQITTEYAQGDNFYRPNYTEGGTDSRGIFSYYLFIDQIPNEATVEKQSFTITVSG